MVHRIDNSTAAAALPAARPATGQPGFFTNGNPVSGEGATVLSDDWLNMVQEELAGVVTAAGLPLDRSNNAQLVAAIRALINERATGISAADASEIFSNLSAGFLLSAVAARTYQPAGNYAQQADLDVERQRAIQAESGLLPLTGGIVSGTISRAGGGVLPEVLGTTKRTVIQAFTIQADNGVAVPFPQSFSGPPVAIVVNALESDWDVGAAAGTWTATGFKTTKYSVNTAGRPQQISVIAIGPG